VGIEYKFTIEANANLPSFEKRPITVYEVHETAEEKAHGASGWCFFK
jgi:hypothetical protein